MVNMQPGNENDGQWYPQLPEGYVQQPRQNNMDYNYQDMGMQGYGAQEYYQEPPMYASDFGGGPSDQVTALNGFPDFGQQGFPGQQFMPNFGPPGFPQGGGMPPFGQPGFPQGGGMPPFGDFGNQYGNQGNQQGQQGPSSPPPSFTPPYPSSRGGAQVFAVDPGAISGCLYRNTYIWTSRRNGFWMFPTFVGRTSVAGFRWRNRQRRWEYTGIDLNRIDKFSCF